MTARRPTAIVWTCATVFLLSLACGRGGMDQTPERGKGKVGKVGKRKAPVGNGEMVATPTSTDWTHVTIRDAVERDAVCNNGEPATWFWVEGEGEARDSWIVYLRGGGGCGSIESCQERMDDRGHFMKPVGAGRPPRLDGLMSSDPKTNPDFHDWTKVYIPYCSSDSWMGDAPASEATGGFHFRGSRIVEAVIEDLRDLGPPGGPKLADADKLLLAGGSAGAMGMRMNVDRVAEMLPTVPWKRGVGDGFIVPPREASPEEERLVRERYTMQNARPDDSCVEAVGDKIWECTETRNIREHIETPIFTYMDVLDANLTERYGIEPGTPEAARLGKEIRKELLGMGPGVFATANGKHVIVTSKDFQKMTTRVNGRPVCYADVLGNWAFDRKGPKSAVPDHGD